MIGNIQRDINLHATLSPQHGRCSEMIGEADIPSHEIKDFLYDWKNSGEHDGMFYKEFERSKVRLRVPYHETFNSITKKKEEWNYLLSNGSPVSITWWITPKFA